MIKLLLEIKLSFLIRKIRSSLNMGYLKVDINLPNQHCTSADLLADSLTDLLRQFDSQSTQGIQGLKHLDSQDTQGIWRALGHSGTQGTWALGHLRHSGTRALKTLGHLRHSSTQRAFGNLGTEVTWALGQPGTQNTWTLEALAHSRRTWALGHSSHLDTSLEHLGTRELEMHSGTQALEHLSTQGTQGTLFSRFQQ